MDAPYLKWDITKMTVFYWISYCTYYCMAITFLSNLLQSVPKKMSFLGKIAITTLKLIQNANVGGVLENSGYLLPYGDWDFQNWRRNDWENDASSCQPPLQKWAEFSALNIHWLILSAILEVIVVLKLDTSGPGYKTNFTLPSTKVWNKFCFHCKSWKCRGSSKECIMWAVNSANF